ncbi:MAG: hypothetical protein NTY38_20505, partial [Acidobacteria bacterium]|nr:hypothetical protein [Acidobacteriota bacterium]
MLVWRSAHYKEGIALVDHEEGKADFSEPDTLAASWLGRYSRGTYPLDSILLQTAADFIRPQAGLSDNVEAWNRRFAYPELRIATPAEYFRHVEQGNTAAIPRLRGAFPDTWNDQKATMAAPSALARRLESGLPDAEKWATLCASAGLGTTSPDASFEEAYHQLLMYEDHTLGWVARNDPYTPEKDGGGQEHYRQKAAYAEKAEQQRSQAQQQSLRALTRQVGGGAGLVVWNPLSWSRAGLAELPKGCNAASLRDRATGAILACQTDHTGTRFWSSDVPALGYRSYDVLTTSPAPAGTGFRRDSTTLENDFYLIRIDPPSGGIASLVDKLTGRDLVDARAPHKLGQLAYLLYRQESLSRFTTLGELRPGKFWVEAGPSGAVSSSIKASGMIEHALTFELEVTLYAAVKRIDLALRVNKRVNYAKEVVCAAFPFCIQQEPDRYGQARIPVQVDFPGGWFRPEHDQLPSSGFDTYVSQHAVQLEDPGMRVVWASLDVPAFHIGGVHASRWLQTLSGQGRELQKPWLYSHIMSNHWVTNCPIAQGGAVLFRYSIVSGRPERELGPAKRFGWEAASPLVAVAGEGAGHWPATRPLLEVSPASAGLAGLKRAEDGDELIARIVEGTGHAAD